MKENSSQSSGRIQVLMYEKPPPNSVHEVNSNSKYKSDKIVIVYISQIMAK